MRTDPRTGVSAQGERRFRPSSAGIPAQNQHVVVDDRMSKLVDTEVHDADFGDLAADLSVVGELPTGPSPSHELARGKKKILIVDDEQEIRRLLRRVLEERGYFVVEADRGRAALQVLKAESPDLIILDAMLPEIHGFDIARRIRGSTRYGHVPIIMVSAVYRGWRIAEDVKSNYGVDFYIEKPFRVADVVAAVQSGLESRKEQVDPERINKDAEKLLNDGVAAYKAGDLDKATELLEAGTRLDPLAYRLRFHLGLLYGKRGQVYDAIQQLERAVEIQSKHFASVKNLAILYQQAGFKNKAVETWQRALTIAPDEETRKVIKEHLVGLL
jgi:DNA-binding response OmpR family regulator